MADGGVDDGWYSLRKSWNVVVAVAGGDSTIDAIYSLPVALAVAADAVQSLSEVAAGYVQQ